MILERIETITAGQGAHTSDRRRETVRPIDASARLAIEAGSRRGYSQALTEMAALDLTPRSPVPSVETAASFEASPPPPEPVAEAAAETSADAEPFEPTSLSDSVDAEQTLSEAPAAAPAGAAANQVETVSMTQLVEAVAESVISRVVVIAPFAEPGIESSALAYARAMTERAAPVAYVDLTDGSATRDELGAIAATGGLRALVEGTATIADVIERDPYSLLHVIPSCGLAFAALAEEAQDALAFYLKALSEAYPVCILDWPVAGLDAVEAIHDADTAIVVAAPDWAAEEVFEIAGLISEASLGDVLHLVTTAQAEIDTADAPAGDVAQEGLIDA